ncbi:MAG: cytochrome c [Chloroflexi bacterium]|nr:cytochrome c [Chloroflexota bacterium]
MRALVFAVLILVISACATNPVPAPAPTVAGPTAGQLGDAGKAVFANRCASCHGQNGQGVTAPANIGPNANLQKFSTAKGLYDYVSVSMPQDAPGGLSPQEYLQLVSYLLVENKFVKLDAPLDQGRLDGIALKK